MTPLQTAALKLLALIDERQDRYRKLNKQIVELQGDFYTHLQFIDRDLEVEVVGLLDQILGDTIASYYLYDLLANPRKGRVLEADGKEYPIRNVNDVCAYVERNFHIPHVH